MDKPMNRGPYKRYHADVDAPLPRTTIWNWKNQNKRRQQLCEREDISGHVYDTASSQSEPQCDSCFQLQTYPKHANEDCETEPEPQSDDHGDIVNDPGLQPEEDPSRDLESDRDPEDESDYYGHTDEEDDTGSHDQETVQPGHASKMKPDSDHEHEPDSDSQQVSEPDPDSEPDPESDQDPDPEEDPDQGPDPEEDPDQDPDPEEDPDPNPNPEEHPDPDSDPEEDPDPDSDPETDPDPDDDPVDGLPQRDGHEWLYAGSNVTADQARALLLAYIFKHGVSSAGLEDLLKLLTIFFPGILPPSKFLFRRQYAKVTDVVYHVLCENCSAYIGMRNSLEGIGSCEQCGMQYNIQENIDKDCFFITIPLKDQLKDLLENHNVTKGMQVKSHFAGLDEVSDICSGSAIKELTNSEQLSDHDLTLTFNIDGVPIFKSSNRSLWPIQCTVNELHVDDRNRNVLIQGLWFGPTKPSMSSFLKPLRAEMEILGRDGFEWRNPVTGANVKSKVFILCGTCDAVARPLVRNCTQFNGAYGCDWCHHPGERVPKGDGFVRTYPFVDPQPQLRCLDGHIEDAARATELGEPVHGVKGPTALMLFPKFNVVSGFVVEYMHCVLLGVVRQIVTLWMDSTYHRKPWYIGTRIHDVDAQLLKIAPPSEITRVPRTLTTRNFWKASEWRSFLLFYSLLILQGVLPAEFLQHWFLLVYASYTLLQSNISKNDIDKAELALNKFVIQMSVLYGKEHLSFNVHQLCHWAQSVRTWGSGWSHSAFPFEGNNRCLLKLFHGTQHISLQIAQNFLLDRATKRLANECMATASERCKDMFAHLTHSGSYRPVQRIAIQDVQLLGRPKVKQIDVRHQIAVEHLVGEGRITSPSTYFERFQYNGRVYHCCSYDRCVKRDNSILQLHTGEFCRVETCVVVTLDCRCVGDCNCAGSPVVLVSVLRKTRAVLYSDRQLGLHSTHISQVALERTPLKAVFADSIKEKCVVCKRVADVLYVATFPNHFERD